MVKIIPAFVLQRQHRKQDYGQSTDLDRMVKSVEQNMKQRIADVLREMIQTTGPDRITVSKLVEKCGISRSLFYYYYTDVFDVMSYNVEQDLEEAVTESLREKTPEASIALLLKLIMSHRKGIIRVMDSKYRVEAQRGMLDAAEKYAERLIMERGEKSILTLEEVHYHSKLASYVVFGFVMDNLYVKDPDIDGFVEYLVKMVLHS